MIEFWLDLPAVTLFAVLALAYATTGAALAWMSFGALLGPSIRKFDGVVAPFFGPVSLLFALLTGFLANDIADRNRQATRTVQAEAGELRNVYMLSLASPSDMRSIRIALAAYVKALVDEEWPAMADDQAAPSASLAYDALLRELSESKIAPTAGTGAHTALLNAAVRAGIARSDRLALAVDRTNGVKWVMVLLLGGMTQLSIAVVHLQKRNAQAAALAIFSVAAVIALGMIALQERPFAGGVRIGPGPLAEILKLPA